MIKSLHGFRIIALKWGKSFSIVVWLPAFTCQHIDTEIEMRTKSSMGLMGFPANNILVFSSTRSIPLMGLGSKVRWVESASVTDSLSD